MRFLPRPFAELGAPLRVIASIGARDTTELLVGDSRGWLHRLGPTGDVVASLRAHEGAITSLAIARDRTWVTGSEDGYVKRWRDHRLVSVVKAPDLVTSIAIDERGDVVCAGYDGAIWCAREG